MKKLLLLPLLLLPLLLPSSASAYNLHTPECQDLQLFIASLSEKRTVPISPEERAEDIDTLLFLVGEANWSVREKYSIILRSMVSKLEVHMDYIDSREKASLQRAWQRTKSLQRKNNLSEGQTLKIYKSAKKRIRARFDAARVKREMLFQEEEAQLGASLAIQQLWLDKAEDRGLDLIDSRPEQ